MTLPRLTAEYGIGPALHSYSAAAPRTAGAEVVPMDFFGDLGNVFGGVLTKVPCLIGCGLPNALALVTECGVDPLCYIEHAPSAVAGCIRQCLQ